MSTPRPWPPRGLSDDEAAYYVGLSKTTFIREVEAEQAPAPVWLTKGRRIWLREDLDAYLDRKAGRVQTGASGADDGSEWMARLGQA